VKVFLENINSDNRSIITQIILVSILLICAGCKPSLDEEQLKEIRTKTKEKVNERQNQIIEQTEVGNLVKKYNAKYFPQGHYSEKTITYEIQTYLEGENNVVFKGYLVDIIRDGDGALIKLLCPMILKGTDENKSVLFTLTMTPKSMIEFFLDATEKNNSNPFTINPSIEYFYVACKIDHIKRNNIFDLDLIVQPDKVGLSTTKTGYIKYVASGKYIDFWAKPINNK
jgi:hypothetical protein